MVNIKDLKEKAINCYISFLTKLNYGLINQDYSILYATVLCIKNNITDRKYQEYFYNNLNCNMGVKLVDSNLMRMIIGYTLNSSGTFSDSFVFNETQIPNKGTYDLETHSLYGFNYLYISVPKGVDFSIYDALGNNITNEFIYVGEKVTSLLETNSIYRKDNVYNSINSINFNIKIR